jgi:hypothetical protein
MKTSDYTALVYLELKEGTILGEEDILAILGAQLVTGLKMTASD